MFPDPSLKWRPYPSIMDGMKAPPMVLDRGISRGVLNLLVFEDRGIRAYGVEIECQIYGAFEEMIYSIAQDDGNGSYHGEIYLKEAVHSKLLEAFRNIDPVKRNPRHFLFVGGDYCFEVLGFSEPVIRAFDSRDEAYAWSPRPEL